jgi:hypothetical protein
MEKGAAQREVARKEGLQPLTHENLAEFHEEEESWEDPKDYGTPFPPRCLQSHSAWPRNLLTNMTLRVCENTTAEMHPRFSVFWLFFSASRPLCGEEALPVAMKVMTLDPPTEVEAWITRVNVFLSPTLSA